MQSIVRTNWWLGLGAAALLAGGCRALDEQETSTMVAKQPATETPQGALVADVNAWHATRMASLRSADGWLTLVGLAWLEEGENRVGRRDGDRVAYDGFPVDDVGVLHVDGEQLRFVPAAGANVTGLPADGRLLSDAGTGGPTVLTIGSCRFHVMVRGGRLAVRLKDSAAPLRETLPVVERYPVEPALRFLAAFEPADTGATLPVSLIIGSVDDQEIAGRARLTVAGRERTLVLMPGRDADHFFVVFGDATNGSETYGGGRFLEARRMRGVDDHGGPVVEIDFNRSYNPPCSFTPYATCPLPVAENRWDDVAITAGEKRPVVPGKKWCAPSPVAFLTRRTR